MKQYFDVGIQDDDYVMVFAESPTEAESLVRKKHPDWEIRRVTPIGVQPYADSDGQIIQKFL